MTATFAGLAKYYAAAQRFWRSLPDTIEGPGGPQPITVEQAQARLDAWCATKGDARPRVILETDGTHRRTTLVNSLQRNRCGRYHRRIR